MYIQCIMTAGLVKKLYDTATRAAGTGVENTGPQGCNAKIAMVIEMEDACEKGPVDVDRNLLFSMLRFAAPIRFASP